MFQYYCITESRTSNMNHTRSTLVVIALTIGMITATVVIAVGASTEHYAFAKGKAVKAGNTKNKCAEAADNSQHITLGANAVGNSATNLATNIQTQVCNAGSTSAG
jgi:hypothetical protein